MNMASAYSGRSGGEEPWLMFVAQARSLCWFEGQEKWRGKWTKQGIIYNFEFWIQFCEYERCGQNIKQFLPLATIYSLLISNNS